MVNQYVKIALLIKKGKTSNMINNYTDTDTD